MRVVQVQALQPRSLLRDFLSGGLSLEAFRMAITPLVMGRDDAFVDQIVGIMFADGEGADTPELRRELRALVIGEEVPDPKQEGTMAAVPGSRMLGRGSSTSRVQRIHVTA